MKAPSVRKSVVLALLVVVLIIAGSTWRLGSKLIEPANHPVPLPSGFQPQTVSIQGSGHFIAGWWNDNGNGSPVVLLLHAVRADRSSMVSRAQLLMQNGFSVLLIDLQAHGETPGEAITLGYRESADVVAARDWIKRTAPRRRVGVVGCSLGGASVLLAPQPSGFDAVVLEAVYPRIAQAVEDRIRIRLGFLAPMLTPLLLMQLQPRLHLSASDLEPIRSISRLAAPVLVAAGSKDEHTTMAESRELFMAASVPKELWIVDGARHQDFLAYDPRGYEAHVVRFLMGALGVEANAVNVAEMGKSGDVPALHEAAESGTWGIAGTPGETRWIEIHQVEPWNGTRLYHIEVLGRMTGRPGWQVVHVVPHMAISEAALKRSVTGASHQRCGLP